MDCTALKVRLTLGSVPGARMVYPASYMEFVSSRAANNLCEFHTPHDSGFDHGSPDEYILVVVPTAIAEMVLAAPDADQYEELTAAEYDAAFSASYAKRDFEIDRDVMLAIQTRIAAGITLSPEETEALDPTHPRRGFVNAPKTLAERIPASTMKQTATYIRKV